MVPQKTTNKLRTGAPSRHSECPVTERIVQARTPLQIFAFLVGYRKLRGVSWAVNGEPFAGQQRESRSSGLIYRNAGMFDWNDVDL